MHFTLAISIAMAAVAGALPQGPGGSRAIVGWCASGVPGCGYGSLWDCSARGGNTYTYCTQKCRCENKRQPPVTPTIPSNPSKRPTLPPSEQLPLVKSEDKTSDASVTPIQDGYTFDESETPPTEQEYTYETTGFTNEGEDTSQDNNYFDDSSYFTASTEGNDEASDDTYYDDSLNASAEETETPEEDTSYYDEEYYRI